jgi:hypothetical protein
MSPSRECVFMSQAQIRSSRGAIAAHWRAPKSKENRVLGHQKPQNFLACRRRFESPKAPQGRRGQVFTVGNSSAPLYGEPPQNPLNHLKNRQAKRRFRPSQAPRGVTIGRRSAANCAPSVRGGARSVHPGVETVEKWLNFLSGAAPRTPQV